MIPIDIVFSRFEPVSEIFSHETEQFILESESQLLEIEMRKRLDSIVLGVINHFRY